MNDKDVNIIAAVVTALITAISVLIGAIASFISSNRNSKNEQERVRVENRKADVDIAEQLQKVSAGIVTQLNEHLEKCEEDKGVILEKLNNLQDRYDALEHAMQERDETEDCASDKVALEKKVAEMQQQIDKLASAQKQAKRRNKSNQTF